MMYSVPTNIQSASPSNVSSLHESDRQLYFALLEERSDTTGQVDDKALSASHAFLVEQLRLAAEVNADFPDEMQSLPSVLRNAHDQTAQAYRHYLDGRHAGLPRRYFSCRSHALYFLRAVAPTKLVDGAWLYGLLKHWQDPRITSLIQTYLEELGCGNATQNHVVLYKQLLARYGCDNWQNGPDEHFTQGAVQLALAHHAHGFFPELIGFNLGYEQLALHLPITAYELNELDIDPYYFSLHVTIDNVSTGHARKALQSVLDCAPRVGNVAEFHRRVRNGYRLNLVGMGTNQAIASFDLEQELLRVFADKAVIGTHLHSDYCQIGGRTVSDWLSSPDEMGALLTALQSTGWIRRGENPERSRFWRLLTDDQAPMLGVFDGYEQQLLWDWILADANTTQAARTRNSFRNRQTEGHDGGADAVLPNDATVEQIIARHAGKALRRGSCADVDALFRQLAGVDTKAEAFAVLTGMLSPSNHPTPAGLAATRLYANLFQQAS